MRFFILMQHVLCHPLRPLQWSVETNRTLSTPIAQRFPIHAVPLRIRFQSGLFEIGIFPLERIKTDVGGTSQRDADDLEAMVWRKQTDCQ